MRIMVRELAPQWFSLVMRSSSRLGSELACFVSGRIVLIMLCYVMLATMGVHAARADSVSPATIADAQCVLVGARLSASKDQKQRLSAEMLLVYFVGRIAGRSPNIDLEQLVDSEARRMTEADFKNAAVRCGRGLSAGGAEITRIGKSLERLEE